VEKSLADIARLGPADWPELLEQLGLAGIVYNIASNSELRCITEDALQFVLDQDNASLFNSGHADQIQRALERHFGQPLSVRIEQGAVAAETPAMCQARQREERQAEAVAAIEADPALQALISRFDGELDRSSITVVDS
jgi:DNA polymerase-3 subunit gamma/tau